MTASQPDDTGKAIDKVIDKLEEDLSDTSPVTYENARHSARTALQELIQEESANARFTEAFHIAKLESISGLPEANNRIAEGWNGTERSSDD